MRVVFLFFGSSRGSIGRIISRGLWIDSSSRARTHESGREGVMSTTRG